MMGPEYPVPHAEKEKRGIVALKLSKGQAINVEEKTRMALGWFDVSLPYPHRRGAGGRAPPQGSRAVDPTRAGPNSHRKLNLVRSEPIPIRSPDHHLGLRMQNLQCS